MAVTARLPGPKGAPFVGSAPAFARDPLGFLERCHKDHGDLSAFTLMNVPVVLVAHPELIEAVLVTQARAFIKSRDYQHDLEFMGHGLLTSEGDVWLRQRRLMQPAFHKRRIDHYAKTMTAYATRLLSRWHDGETRDIHADMLQLTLEIVAKTLFDKDVAGDAEEIGRALEVFLDDPAGEGDWFGALIPKAFPTPANLRFRRAVAAMDRLVYAIISERRAVAEDRGDLLSMLLAAQAEDGSRMSDRQLRDELMTLIFAGHETTANTLSWTLLLLDQYPNVEAKLHTELREVLAGRPASAADVPKLRYTALVIKEAMRVYPPVWGIGREATRDVALGDYTIPKGTQVFIAQWLAHRDPRFFETPERFIPERWADGLEKRLPKYAYFPFGGGPRLCIGNSFALMEATLLLATIAQHTTLRLEPNHPVKFHPTITLRPKHGLRMMVKHHAKDGLVTSE